MTKWVFLGLATVALLIVAFFFYSEVLIGIVLIILFGMYWPNMDDQVAELRHMRKNQERWHDEDNY